MGPKPETKVVKIGGKWQAEIKRPSWGVYVQWKQLLHPRLWARSTEPSAPPASEQTIWAFAEKELIPDCVLRFIDDKGADRKPAEVYLPDLGNLRFMGIIREVDTMMREADEAAFRLEEQDAEGGSTGDAQAVAADAAQSE